MKAQMSTEFMVVLSAMLIVFVILFAVSSSGNLNLLQMQDSAASLRNAQSVAAAINYVYLAGPGASYNLTLSNIGNQENITISDYSVTSTRIHSSAGAPLLDADVGAGSVGRGDTLITNNGGEIDIS